MISVVAPDRQYFPRQIHATTLKETFSKSRATTHRKLLCRRGLKKICPRRSNVTPPPPSPNVSPPKAKHSTKTKETTKTPKLDRIRRRRRRQLHLRFQRSPKQVPTNPNSRSQNNLIHLQSLPHKSQQRNHQRIQTLRW